MGGGSTDFSSSRYDYTDTPSVTRRSAADYAKDDKREYKAPPSRKGIDAPVGRDIEAADKYSLVLVLDTTGSMKTWPEEIFQKAATMYAESNAALQGIPLKKLVAGQKLEDLLGLSIISIGDATYRGDHYPLQVLDFLKGDALIEGIKKIYPEGEGGVFGRESYELAAYYLLNHCKVPDGVKPVLVFACDEDFYSKVDAGLITKLTGDKVDSDLDSDTVIKDLAKKFDTYVLRPEPQGDNPGYRRAHAHWESLLGAQRVLRMESSSRLVDCIIGLCGYSAENFKVAEDLLKRRQTPEQVAEVLRALHPLISSTSSAKPKRKAKNSGPPISI
jgi:hypothetical protein